MTHSKPQVTIDLAEYNELLASANKDTQAVTKITTDYNDFVKVVFKSCIAALPDPYLAEQLIKRKLVENGYEIALDNGIIKFRKL